ncbi:MAG: hypothetical protein GEU98_07745 [Pseudonocardiaceae bacterium]|nr:hypothetical protein [Pseudonocardiaceae bacterium]
MDPSDRLTELLHSFQRSSWRWECQGHYAVDEAKLQRWRAGLPRDEEARRPWLGFIHGLRVAGATFERVRMLTEPLTEYLRWMLEGTQHNVEAGEDIRWIQQSMARDLGMPAYDFYLFDDQRVAIMRFDDDKLLTDLEVTDDPTSVERHRAYRDAIWPQAVRHADYYAPRST